jgi:hypothetical protein
MGAEIDLELRFQAEEQYIAGQVTLEQLAERTGISMTQLGRWCSEEGWREKRREYRKAFADIRRNTVELRRKFVEKALVSLNPMDAFAISALEKLALQAEKSAAGGSAPQPAVPEGGPVFKTAAEAVAVLKGVVEQKLQRMLVTPDAVNLASVKEIQQCLDLLGKMEAKVAPDEAAGAGPQTLSEEKIKELREQLNL